MTNGRIEVQPEDCFRFEVHFDECIIANALIEVMAVAVGVCVSKSTPFGTAGSMRSGR
jgi:hypothetical protein